MEQSYGLKYFLSVLALVLVLEGMPYFISPGGVRKWLQVIGIMSDSAIRGIGLVFMLIGITILYIALRVV